MKKRLLALTLGVSMTTGLLAGCGGGRMTHLQTLRQIRRRKLLQRMQMRKLLQRTAQQHPGILTGKHMREPRLMSCSASIPMQMQ